MRPPLLLLVAACAAPACTTAKASPEAGGETGARPVHVETVEVRDEPMPRALALTGTLRAWQHTDLAANASGKVLATFVERGSEVKAGDVLARLDTRIAALTAAEAKAQAELARSLEATAKRECARYEALLAKGAVSQGDFDRISDQCKSSPLSLAAAESRASAAAQVLGDGQIRAPFAGVVTERFIEVGQFVRQDTRIASIASVDRLRLELTVPEAEIATVIPGGALRFEVPAYPGRAFDGTIRYVGAAVREATRDLVAEAEVRNPDRALRPGMFASIRLLAGEAPEPVVPKRAVVVKDGKPRVFALVDGRLEERVVQLGDEKGDVVAVLRGVRAGDKLVQAPTDALQNGQAAE